MKKIIGLVLMLALLSGCMFMPLGKLKSEDVAIDMSVGAVETDLVEKAQKGTEITFEIDEDRSVVSATFKKGDKTETYEKEVTLAYPKVVLKDDLVADVYAGYSLEDFVVLEDGVDATFDLNEETGELTISYRKGIYENTIRAHVEVIDTNPYPIVYRGTRDTYADDGYAKKNIIVVTDDDHLYTFREGTDYYRYYTRVSDTLFTAEKHNGHNVVFGDCVSYGCVEFAEDGTVSQWLEISWNGGPFEVDTFSNGVPDITYFALDSVENVVGLLD